MKKFPWAAWALAVAGVIAISWLAFTMAPDRVPMHRGASMAADAWGTRLDALLLYGGIALGSLVGMPLLMRLTNRWPHLMNFPSDAMKAYWTRPENVPQLGSTSLAFGGWMGVLMAALMMGLQSVEAFVWRFADVPSTPWLFGVVLGLFLLLTGVLIWWYLRALKVPEPTKGRGEGSARR